jgi:hypothetical protein
MLGFCLVLVFVPLGIFALGSLIIEVSQKVRGKIEMYRMWWRNIKFGGHDATSAEVWHLPPFHLMTAVT